MEKINKNIIKLFITIILTLLISLSFASAMIVDSVDIDKLYPGKSVSLEISVKNTLNEDVEDVSLVLNLEPEESKNVLTGQTENIGGTPFTTVGSSEDSEDSINEGDSEKFNYQIKAPFDIKPGDYNIPYTLKYTDSNNDKTTKTGSFGITVSAKTELSYDIEAKENVVGQQGKVSVKIVNSGLGDIRFVSVKITSSNNLEILSSTEEYIGTVGSDDFELATFDVIYKKTGASLTAQIKYKDFDNNEQTDTITLPVNVYSKEKALELGLIKKPNYILYGSIIIIIIAWIVYRKIKKRKKKDGKWEKI